VSDANLPRFKNALANRHDRAAPSSSLSRGVGRRRRVGCGGVAGVVGGMRGCRRRHPVREATSCG